jgi:cytidyltransferase-like protein
MKEDLTGKILNNRLILKIFGTKENGYRYIYEVKCLNCGNIYNITKSNILRTKNCYKCCPRTKFGKLNSKWKGGKYISGEYYSQIKHNSKLKKFKFNMSIKYLEELYENQNKKCKFTGDDISFEDNTASLDRIDSSKGYVKGNVQWVHKDINKIKNNKTDNDFINYCIRLYQYTHNNKNILLPPVISKNTHKNFKGYEYIPLDYYTSIKKGAIERNIEFNISIKETNDRFVWQGGKCNLSGEDLFFTKHYKNGPFKHRGTASLDRIDNTKGYTPDNIQWIHKDINMLKYTLSMDYLLNICKKITKKFTPVVAISGYFQILHAGHIEYIQSSRKYGGYLIAIINSDEQSKLKITPSIINEHQRAYIINNIKGVDEVMISIDKDKSIAKTLELIKPNIFCNGGDRTSQNSSQEELDVCKKHNIKIVYTGGNKIDSSSDILNRAHKILSNKQ